MRFLAVLLVLFVAPAYADDATIVFNGHNQSTENANRYTFTLSDIGDADYLMLSPFAEEGAVIVNFTVGGELVTRLESGAWIVEAPENPNSEVVIEFSSVRYWVGLNVFGLTNIEDPTSVVDADSGTDPANTLSVNVEPGGVVYVVAIADGLPDFVSSRGFELHHVTLLEGGWEFTAASQSFAEAQTPLTLNLSVTGANERYYRVISLR